MRRLALSLRKDRHLPWSLFTEGNLLSFQRWCQIKVEQGLSLWCWLSEMKVSKFVENHSARGSTENDPTVRSPRILVPPSLRNSNVPPRKSFSHTGESLSSRLYTDVSGGKTRGAWKGFEVVTRDHCILLLFDTKKLIDLFIMTEIKFKKISVT